MWCLNWCFLVGWWKSLILSSISSCYSMVLCVKLTVGCWLDCAVGLDCCSVRSLGGTLAVSPLVCKYPHARLGSLYFWKWHLMWCETLSMSLRISCPSDQLQGACLVSFAWPNWVLWVKGWHIFLNGQFWNMLVLCFWEWLHCVGEWNPLLQRENSRGWKCLCNGNNKSLLSLKEGPCGLTQR